MPPEHHVVDGIGPGLVYTALPKVACTSIKEALVETAHNHPGARTRCELRLSNETRAYYRFAFVRNPFDRLVSCYADKVVGIDQNGSGYYFASHYNDWLVKTTFGSSFHQSMSFDEFVSLAARIPDWLSDAHFRSQYSLLFSTRTLRPDYIGRFERISEDWEYLSARFELAPLRFLNVSRKRSESWADHYTSEETVRTVWDRYRGDIETFGYCNEYRHLLQRFGASP